jgi:hypothetical protein
MALDAQRLAEAYVDFCLGDSAPLVALMGNDFHDHVSGRGPEMWTVVAGWSEASLAERAVDLHGVGVTPDGRVMVWITMHGTHVGSAFPWMRGRPASGRRVSSGQLHVFRVDGDKIVEHWAVRDDLRMLEAIDGRDEPSPSV